MTAIVPLDSAAAIQTTDDARAIIGGIADQTAARHAFANYRDRKSANTLRRHHNDLGAFADYLAQVRIVASAVDLATGPDAWRGMTWGIVAGFVPWLLDKGYAIATINARLSTVKVYARLAAQAGAITHEQYAMMQTVTGYQHKEVKRVDEKRQAAGVPTRRGAKKAESVIIPSDVRRRLKQHPDTPQGRRDALLMCLLLDHGLRCGELAALQVSDIDLQAGVLRFYRPKVDKTQTHELTRDSLRAVRAWFESGDAPADGPLLRGSRKGGALTGGMSERAITKRVEYLGRVLGIVGLSAHDGRHDWATTATRNGTDPFRLKDAGGWTSMATVDRYVAAARIANEGVKLD